MGVHVITNNSLLDSITNIRVVKLAELVVGAVLLFGSAYGYFHSSYILIQVQNQIIGIIPQLFPRITTDPSSNLLSIDHPTTLKIIKVTQYGFVALAVSGLVLLGYGAVAKKQNSTTANEKFHN